ncbi:hypothetical protein DSO57_1035642 [Entomophthora muscae]|uniref:Uncharacterized protein n=1 Tax=Entomophthora muscae TaxID=34485 RepID=A0ACC2TL92_9FUNG|nr:hypothetical protein DSO57_1035642 [Entomophthora muscae]
MGPLTLSCPTFTVTPQRRLESHPYLPVELAAASLVATTDLQPSNSSAQAALWLLSSQHHPLDYQHCLLIPVDSIHTSFGPIPGIACMLIGLIMPLVQIG